MTAASPPQARRTPDLKIETGVPGPRGEYCQIDNELWIADVTGAKQPKRILRGHAGIYKIGPDLVLGGFQSPQFSVEGRIVFFEANTWAIDGAIYSLDLTSGFLRLICVGIGFQVITEGKYKEYLIANKNMPNYPTHVHSYWLLDPVENCFVRSVTAGNTRFRDSKTKTASDRLGYSSLTFSLPKFRQVFHHAAHSPQRSVVKRQDHKFVMNAIFILEAEVRRSHESEAGVVGRITQDNHRVISGLPAPLQPLADQF